MSPRERRRMRWMLAASALMAAVATVVALTEGF